MRLIMWGRGIRGERTQRGRAGREIVFHAFKHVLARSRSIKTQQYQARKYLARYRRFYKASLRTVSLPALCFDGLLLCYYVFMLFYIWA